MRTVPHYIVVDGDIVATESSLADALQEAEQYHGKVEVVADGIVVWRS